jgi:hypothetical protein
MADTIRLVKGDSKPVVILTLTDESTDSAFDLSPASVTVSVRFRKQNSTTLLSTIPCSLVNNGTDGKVQFDFAGGILDDVDPGQYEGEVVVTTSGAGTQTVYELLSFRVRDNLT